MSVIYLNFWKTEAQKYVTFVGSILILKHSNGIFLDKRSWGLLAYFSVNKLRKIAL